MAQLVARLVRNEKVGGSNPPSSTTGRHPIWVSVFCMPGVVLRWRVAVAPLVFRAPSGPAAREARASLRSAPRLEARPCPPVPPAPSTLAASGVLVCGGPGPATAHRRCGLAPPPPTGAAAWPRRRPSTRARVSAWTVTVAFNVARANLVCDFRQVLFIAILRRLHFAVFECVSPTGWLFRKGDVMVGDTWRQFPRFDLWMSLVTRRAIHGCE